MLVKDLADEYIPNPSTTFPSGYLATARVLSISQTDSLCRLTLKSSAIVGDTKAQKEIATLDIGSTVVGTVHKVTDFGVFIAIKGTR